MRKAKVDDKVTWEDIYKDFRMRHPNLAKMITYWCPRDYLTIQVYLSDGMMLAYDYWNHKASIMKETWIKKD